MSVDRDEQFLDLAANYRTLAKDYRETLQHGSLNFRKYRTRATVAFVGLFIAMAAMGWWNTKISQDGRDNLALASARAQYESCVSGNKVRGGIVLYLEKLTAQAPPERRARAKPAIDQAKVIFAPRDCGKVAGQLLQRSL